MNPALTITGRDARDRLTGLLGLGVPHPLRDLKLEYVEMVAQGVRPQIAILGAQAGVTYRLCDEDGNPLAGVDPAEGSTAADSASLLAPAVKEDVAYSILASRRAGTVLLETYLAQRVFLKAGINTKLVLEFVPSPGQVASGNRLVVSYDEPVTVAVRQTQEGVYYRLVQAGPKEVFLSPEELLGTQGDLHFITEAPLREDLGLRIKAYRKVGKLKPAYLETSLEVAVRPNPQVQITTIPQVADFGGKARLVLAGFQDTARYRLLAVPVTPADYVPEGTPDALVVPTPEDERERVCLRVPPRGASPGSAAGFEPAADFSAAADRLEVATVALASDAFFLVAATKLDNQETLLLDATAAVLVRPDTRPQVSAGAAEVAVGGFGQVVVSGTQPGVHYQLRRVADGAEVGAPGFHYEDRGLGSVRLEVDLVVEEVGDLRVLLPTGPLDQTTQFRVVAAMNLTGIRAELAKEVTIEVKAPPASESRPASRSTPPGPLKPAKSAKPAKFKVASTARRTKATRPAEPKPAVRKPKASAAPPSRPAKSGRKPGKR